ncbi:MAG TPA: peptidoglycan-associated lipoprotein Pal [Nitrospira sp.]|nr:peptidoglycan-associated lipoprotein Pal [Nitrospira sp.]
MSTWVPRIFAAGLLCFMLAPFVGCSGKRAATSSGDAASTSKEKPVETIKPESMATVPGSGTFETAREAGETPSAGGGAEPSAGSPPPPMPSPGLTAPSMGSAEAVTLADIFFDFDQHTIRSDAQSVLSANAAWINRTPGKAIVIEGHCDERGTQAYNLVLGDKRARSTKRYLEDLGVPASRLKTTSYGEMRPFCKDRDETCYQQNRRAHFVVQ